MYYLCILSHPYIDNTFKHFTYVALMAHSTALAALCARTLDNLKGELITVLDLRSVDSSPADYFVVCSANSDTHARALTDALTRATLNLGERRPRSEGRDTGEWVLLDYFDVVVHVFRTDAREYYKLEKLWGDAPTFDLDHIETQAETEEQSDDSLETDVELSIIATKKAPKKVPATKATTKSGTKESSKAHSKTVSEHLKPAKAAPKATKAAPKATKAAPKATKAAPKATKAAPKATKVAPKATKAAPKAAKTTTTPKIKVAPKAGKTAPKQASTVVETAAEHNEKPKRTRKKVSEE
jgi:ribosome-associated protein